MKKVLLVLADGFEEIEAVSVIDILRRALVHVDVAALKEGEVKSARNLSVMPDTVIKAVNPDDYEMIVLPGGMPGAKHLDEDETLDAILKKFDEQEKFIAAICASPFILAKKGILKGCMATSYPSFRDEVAKASDYQDAGVVVDEHIITSRGPATAAEFAFTLVELLKDEETAERLRESMLFNY